MRGTVDREDAVHSPDQTVSDRLDILEGKLARQRRLANAWRIGATGLLALFALSWSAPTNAVRAKTELLIGDAETGQEVHILPGGITFRERGRDRIRIEVTPDFSGITAYALTGAVNWGLGTNDAGSALRIFSLKDNNLRLELTDNLLDAGSGLRLYDSNGKPRATLYTERRGEMGLELTDADRQPRIDIYAKGGGESVFKANDSDAKAVAELSILPESDALFRYTGVIPDGESNDRLVPMLYMLDPSGKRAMQIPDPPAE